MLGSIIFSTLFGAVQVEAREATLNTLIVAAGCFWCVEKDFEKLEGVIKVESVYTGGHTKNPTYKEVSRKNTGHYEAVVIHYNAVKIEISELLKHYWKNTDPLDPKGQFCDKGQSYLSALFYKNPTEKKLMEDSLKEIQKHPSIKGKTVHTKILPAQKTYLAEDYHQDYYKKNPIRYKYYRFNCGRDNRLEELWGKK